MSVKVASRFLKNCPLSKNGIVSRPESLRFFCIKNVTLVGNVERG